MLDDARVIAFLESESNGWSRPYSGSQGRLSTLLSLHGMQLVRVRKSAAAGVGRCTDGWRPIVEQSDYRVPVRTPSGGSMVHHGVGRVLSSAPVRRVREVLLSRHDGEARQHCFPYRMRSP